ncbi:cadherin-like domain-containing protein [Desulfobacterales bacterium]|nr:cadherin-like domain-containing protein [Desulfobacterales bacterium]
MTNTNKKRSFYDVYAYESLEDPGTLIYEIKPNMPGNSKANPQNKSKFFINGIDDLNFAGLLPSPSSDLNYDYNLLAFGSDSTITFSVSSTEKDLSLESISSIYPGRGGKSTLQPYAPSATDDFYALFEDGENGLESPSNFSKSNQLYVLDNDTDENGFNLSIQKILEGPQYGEVEIVDSDGDGFGDYLSYIPNTDLSLNPDTYDTIKYFVNNSEGGTDFATAYISLVPVADIPIITTEITAGASTDETYVKVFATPTDQDQSEFIQSIESVSSLPSGVTVTDFGFTEATSTHDAYKEFLIKTDLNENLSYDFELDFVATSKERLNGDLQSNSFTQDITIVSSQQSLEESYSANRQNMWDTGDAIVFDWEYTLTLFDFDIDESDDVDVPLLVTEIDLFEYNVELDFYTGFKFFLNLSAGEVDANSMFEIDFQQFYNQTTDQLEITPTASLSEAGFNTIFANGQFGIDFLYDIDLLFQADLGNLENNDSENLINADIDTGPKSFNLFTYSTEDLAFDFEIPETPLTVSIAWPQLEVESTEYIENSDVVNGGYNFDDTTGVSNNFFNLNLDIDELIVQVVNYFGVPFPQEVISGEFGPIEYQLFDIDLGLGLNLVQSFEMQFDGLTGSINFNEPDGENTFEFVFGETLVFDNALERFDTNNDELINYSIASAPIANLQNDTGIGLNFNGSIEGPAFSVPLIEIGPLGDAKFSETPTSFTVFDNTFDFEFSESQFLATSPVLV